MAAKFETFIDKAGEHRFRLKAGNGEIILASQGYSAKTGCLPSPVFLYTELLEIIVLWHPVFVSNLARFDCANR
jgi:uncharacterized protein YegP (UPF0339 family)